jgi:hypothetical protein
MVNELEFDNNDNLYPLYQQDREAYNALLEKHGIPLHPELIDKAKKTPAVHQQPDYPPARKTPVVAGGEE